MFNRTGDIRTFFIKCPAYFNAQFQLHSGVRNLICTLPHLASSLLPSLGPSTLINIILFGLFQFPLVLSKLSVDSANSFHNHLIAITAKFIRRSNRF